jgi:hypothetical protein
MIISLSPFATSVKRRYAYPLQQMIRLIPWDEPDRTDRSSRYGEKTYGNVLCLSCGVELEFSKFMQLERCYTGPKSLICSIVATVLLFTLLLL